MVDTSVPMSVEMITNSIRRHVLRGGHGAVRSQPHTSFVQMRDALRLAHAQAHVGTQTPAFKSMNAAKRFVMRKVARVVLYLSQVVTRYQCQFNLQVTEVLSLQQSCLENRAAEATTMQGEIAELKEQITRLRAEISQLKRDGGSSRIRHRPTTE